MGKISLTQLPNVRQDFLNHIRQLLNKEDPSWSSTLSLKPDATSPLLPLLVPLNVQLLCKGE